jgi:hypothetical protein
LRAVDSLTDPRDRELAFLLGEEFPRQLAEAGFTLAGVDWMSESGQTAAP